MNQTRNIRKTLEKYGYPFKSKEHSLRLNLFNKGSSMKSLDKYITGKNSDGSDTIFKCPKALLYQFETRGKYNYSNQCCHKLKKTLLHEWKKVNAKAITITGMRSEEGGNRRKLTCLTNNGSMFHPLIVVTDEWEEEFISRNNIGLCRLYHPPFNFSRTGCRGCPFSLTLQEDLLTMKKLLPYEYNSCLKLWKPVYDEYVRIGYRLDKDFYTKSVQYTIEDYLGGCK